MSRMNDIIRLAAFLFLPFFAFGEVIEVDVGAWTDVGMGMTVDGWEVSKIDRYSDGGAQFKSSTAYALSPVYEDVVTQIVISVKSSSPHPEKILKIAPTVPEDAPFHYVEPTLKQEYVTETFWWSVRESVHQVRLQESEGSSGNWGVKSLTVYTDRIEPPARLREDALYRDAFAAAWNPASRAVRYQIQYGSVTRMPPSYKTIAEWDFSSLTNTSGNTVDLPGLNLPDELKGISGMNVCMQKYEGGHIQIGKGEKLGCLVLPMRSLSEGVGELTGLLCARKYPANGKPTMPIYLVADGRTNDLATVELTNENAEYRFPIPDGIMAESIILSSATNGIALSDQNGRVRVESFAIMSDYVPGSVTTNEFKAIGTRATAKVVKDLAPGEWIWSVKSFDAEGRDSPWSPFRTVILDREMPCCPRPGFSILIR